MQKKIFTVSFITSIALALTAYSNGSFVASIINEKNVGFVFIAISLFTIIGLELVPKILTKIGNKNVGMIFILISTLSVLLLSQTTNSTLSILYFMLFTSSITLLPFVYDIFLEHTTNKEDTGNTRGYFLALTNFAWLCSPYIAGYIIDTYGFRPLFMLSGSILIVALIYMVSKIQFTDVPYVGNSLIIQIKDIWNKKDILYIILLALLLQIFYGVMVVFMPVYLHTHIGFDFKTIGVLFTIMLLPFIIFSVPLGKIADKYIGEKELLILGFTIISITTIISGIYTKNSFIFWMSILVGTRIGATIIESMVDTYFFKKIKESEIGLVSLYRSMSPLGYLVGPLIGTFFAYVGKPEYAFISLGILLLITGILFSYKLHDTK